MHEPSVQDWLRLVLAQAHGCACEQQSDAEQDAAGDCLMGEEHCHEGTQGRLDEIRQTADEGRS